MAVAAGVWIETDRAAGVAWRAMMRIAGSLGRQVGRSRSRDRAPRPAPAALAQSRAAEGLRKRPR
jgi:hypothetical protein